MVDSWNRIPSAGKAQVAPLTEVLICVRHLNASPKNCARPIEASATSRALFGRSQYFRLDRKFTGTSVLAVAAPKPTTVHEYKDQNTVSLQLRAQRNF
jgi:hypothetical protein